MFSNLKIQNFRGIKDLEVEDLGQFNIIFGKNSSGKSSLLEAIFLLTGATAPLNSVKLNNLRGYRRFKFKESYWSNFFYDYDESSEIQIESIVKKKRRVLKITSEVSDDKLILNSDDQSLKLSSRKLLCNLRIGSKLIQSAKLELEFGSSEQAFRSTPLERDLSYNDDFRGFLSNARDIFNETEIVNRLSKYVQNKRKSEFVELLKHIESRINGVEILDDSRIAFDVGLRELVPINFVGDGISRFLSLLLNFEEAAGDCSGIVMVDEIENGFHTSVLQNVWRAVLDINRKNNSQAFVVTHSYEATVRLLEIAGDLKEDIRFFRIESDSERHRVVKYTFDELVYAIEHGIAFR